MNFTIGITAEKLGTVETMAKAIYAEAADNALVGNLAEKDLGPACQRLNDAAASIYAAARAILDLPNSDGPKGVRADAYPPAPDSTANRMIVGGTSMVFYDETGAGVEITLPPILGREANRFGPPTGFYVFDSVELGRLWSRIVERVKVERFAPGYIG